MNANDIRCMVCEMIIKIYNKSDETTEEIAGQLEAISDYAKGMYTKYREEHKLNQPTKRKET